MNPTVLKAIFWRDFVSYFSNPTGYVFICVFVMLTSLAAFWPPEFFSNNLANLDQLSRWMPFILLVFIPAISMSIWAEERRQGTDELLLTMPATDLDVVLGKFSAGVAIYTASLLFSMFSTFLVFGWGLGSPDLGLFCGAYLGYWFVGVAMLSIGMVASFLTRNLTVAFILGTLFNAPLALFGAADLIVKDPAWAQTLRQWSAVEQFGDFERGVVSLSSVSYFVSIVAVMLYVSMVLISKRHWAGGEDGEEKGGHFLLRTIALLVTVGAMNVFLSNHDAVRADITIERLNSLSEKTVQMMRDLGADDDVPAVRVDAYVSPRVPAEYVAQKRDLLATLDELSALSGGKVIVNKHLIENFSEQATLAERTYGIEARQVTSKVRGTRGTEEIFLGVAFSCQLDKVVIPFIDRGIPVEYELLRSIATVAMPQRKRLGLLKTAVNLDSGFTMQGATPESYLIRELRKQYDVVQVDPSSPITERYDALLALQPSSLTPEEMDHFVAAVRAGQPTAIFEDPFPYLWGGEVVGTAQQNRPEGGMMAMFGGGGPPKPKGDIMQLWNLLGVEMDGEEIIWQDYNPYKSQGELPLAWIFVDEGNGAIHPFNPEEPMVLGMRQVMFPVAGSLRPDTGSNLEFTQLIVTGDNTGTMSFSTAMAGVQTGNFRPERRTGESYILAAHVRGEAPSEDSLSLEDLDASDEEGAAEGEEEVDLADTEEEERPDINVVLVSDIDCVSDAFFAIREMGESEDMIVNWSFQNVVMVLNALDTLAGDDRFIEVRKRTRVHRILDKIEEATEETRNAAAEQRDQFMKDASAEIAAVRDDFVQKIAEIEGRTDLNPLEKQTKIEQARKRLGRIRDVNVAALEKDLDRKLRQLERDLNAKVRGVQDFYKMCAVLLPPVLPCLVAVLVYFHRRESEREGVAKTRLRFGGGPSEEDKSAA